MSFMAALAIIVGLLLSLLGIGFFAVLAAVEHEMPSVTTLIPALVGIPILILGCVALKDAASEQTDDLQGDLLVGGIANRELGTKACEVEAVDGRVLVEHNWDNRAIVFIGSQLQVE